MFDVFEGERDLATTLYKFPAWEFIRRNMTLELRKVTSYFKNNVRATVGANVLKNLLNSLNVPISLDIERYVEQAVQRAVIYAKTAQFATPYSTSKVFHGAFYGDGVNEIIYLNDEDINVTEAKDDWRNLESVRVLLHPISDLALLPPDGFKQSTANGLAAVEINMAKLAVQYYCFSKEEIAKRKTDKEHVALGLEHFVKMYVLSNMLPSHLDIVIMNRLKNLFYGEPMSSPIRRLPFTIRDYESRIDRVLNNVIDIVKGKKLLYSNMLMMMPAVTRHDQFEALRMPDLAQTRQINWTYAVSRVSYYKLLIELGEAQSIEMNRGELVYSKRNLRFLKYESILDTKLSPDDLVDVVADISFVREV